MFFRSVILAVVMTSLSWSAQAGKTSPVPPTVSASAKAQINIRVEEIPPSAPLADISIKLKIAHSFKVTSEQEAALQSDTQISLLGITFSPGEDPKFSNGDKSFSITKQIPGGIGPLPLDAKIKGKWNKGIFSSSVTINQNAKDVAISPFAANPEEFTKFLNVKKSSRIVGGETRAENIMLIYTAIQHPSIPSFGVEVPLAADVFASGVQGATAEGMKVEEEGQTIQTKYYAAP